MISSLNKLSSLFFLLFFFFVFDRIFWKKLEHELELELPDLMKEGDEEEEEEKEEQKEEDEEDWVGEYDSLCFLTTMANLPVSAPGGKKPGGGGEPSRIGDIVWFVILFLAEDCEK